MEMGAAWSLPFGVFKEEIDIAANQFIRFEGGPSFSELMGMFSKNVFGGVVQIGDFKTAVSVARQSMCRTGDFTNSGRKQPRTD